VLTFTSSRLQWGSRERLFKLWLTWKVHGGIERWSSHIDYTIGLKDFPVNELTNNPPRAKAFRIWKKNFEIPGVFYSNTFPLAYGTTKEILKTLICKRNWDKSLSGLLNSRLLREEIMSIGIFVDGDSPQLLHFVVSNLGITQLHIRTFALCQILLISAERK